MDNSALENDAVDNGPFHIGQRFEDETAMSKYSGTYAVKHRLNLLLQRSKKREKMKSSTIHIYCGIVPEPLSPKIKKVNTLQVEVAYIRVFQ